MKQSRAEFNSSIASQPDWNIKVYEESSAEGNDIVLVVQYKKTCVVRFEQSSHTQYHVHIGNPVYKTFPDVTTREEKIKKAFAVLEELTSQKLVRSNGSILSTLTDWKYLESQVLQKTVTFGDGMGLRHITGMARIISPSENS